MAGSMVKATRARQSRHQPRNEPPAIAVPHSGREMCGVISQKLPFSLPIRNLRPTLTSIFTRDGGKEMLHLHFHIRRIIRRGSAGSAHTSSRAGAGAAGGGRVVGELGMRREGRGWELHLSALRLTHLFGQIPAPSATPSRKYLPTTKKKTHPPSPFPQPSGPAAVGGPVQRVPAAAFHQPRPHPRELQPGGVRVGRGGHGAAGGAGLQGRAPPPPPPPHTHTHTHIHTNRGDGRWWWWWWWWGGGGRGSLLCYRHAFGQSPPPPPPPPPLPTGRAHHEGRQLYDR
jgi:hypothetical protein